MAIAWPKVKTLIISRTFYRQARTRPTAKFSVLEEFANHCPDLRVLYIPLCTFRRKEKVTMTNHRLQKLHIDYPTSGEPHRLAGRIDALFPHLQTLTGEDFMWSYNDTTRARESEDEDVAESSSDEDWTNYEDENDPYGDFEPDEKLERSWEDVDHIVRTCQEARQIQEKRSAMSC